LAAVDANNGIAQLRVHEYGVDRAGTGAFAAPDTEIPLAVGQASAQGAWVQARQTWASNPVLSPAAEWMRMPERLHDRLLCTTRAHVREQEKHPMHRSIRLALRIFIRCTLRYMICSDIVMVSFSAGWLTPILSKKKMAVNNSEKKRG